MQIAAGGSVGLKSCVAGRTRHIRSNAVGIVTAFAGTGCSELFGFLSAKADIRRFAPQRRTLVPRAIITEIRYF